MTKIADVDRKCGLYVRVASVDQASETKLNEQEEALKAFCSSKSWHNVTVYRDEGLSGMDLDRPAFRQMQIDIQCGKINTVIVTEMNRLTRSISHFGTIYDEFSVVGVDIISLQKNFDASADMERVAAHRI